MSGTDEYNNEEFSELEEVYADFDDDNQSSGEDFNFEDDDDNLFEEETSFSLKEEVESSELSPPQASDFKKAYQSFEELSEHVTKIVSILGVTNINAKELLDLIENKNEKTKGTIEEYHRVFSKLNKLALELNQFFEMSKSIHSDLNKTKTELIKTTGSHQIEMNESLRSFNRNLKIALSNFNTSIESISNNIDTEPIIINLQKNLEQQFKALKLNDVVHAIDNLIDAKNQLDRVSEVLIGKPGMNEGVITRIEKATNKVSKNITSINKRAIFWVSIPTSVLSLITGVALAYGTLNYQLQEKYNKKVQQKIFEIQEDYGHTVQKLNNKYQSYSLFQEKYNLDNSKYFGFFSDTKKPYFVVDEKLLKKPINGKIYIPLK